jgi:hypothetical protein
MDGRERLREPFIRLEIRSVVQRPRAVGIQQGRPSVCRTEAEHRERDAAQDAEPQ